MLSRLVRLTLACLALTLALPALAAGPNPMVRLTTSQGVIELELYADKAPETVKNFLAYVDSGFYNGTIFHRVIPGFMIQGGGFEPGLRQKPTRAPVKNEADNGLRNTVGTVAMARTGDPHSATAQFFINHANNGFLDFRERTPRAWGYAVFGQVTRGLEVVNRIAQAETAQIGPFEGVPVENVVIQRAERIK